MRPNSEQPTSSTSVLRLRIFYGVIVVVFSFFIVRLFYVQVIQHEYFKGRALTGQLKQYEIPAARGVIRAYDGERVVPVVMNQTFYTVYADPSLVKKVDETAVGVAAILGGDAAAYKTKIAENKQRFYVVLAKKVTKQQRDALLAKKYPGIGAQEQSYRIYPQGILASQVLGFVNEEAKGNYGIEQAFDDNLNGVAGELKAVTDVNGVPLAANSENILVPAKKGSDVVLTLDIGMQKELEKILSNGLQRAKSSEGSAMILDANSGAIKAVANLPTYNPSQYSTVENGELFQNFAISHPIEIGSIMKPLTAAAALDQDVIKPSTTFYDPSYYEIDEFKVKNIEEDGGPGTKSIKDLLNLSLNTGATWLLMQMGGGKLNSEGRQAWYKYMTEHYRFGKETGVEQGYEAEGFVPPAKDTGSGINLTYANTTFGQAMTASVVQVAAAAAAMVNGGTYYQPRLVDSIVDSNGKVTPKKPVVLNDNVVSDSVSNAMVPMMQYVVDNHYFARKFDQARYSVGGKTGTAQIAKPTGGYYENDYNGTYMGFVGGDKPQYVIVVFVIKPKIAGYAGSQAAQPIFGDIAHMLIDDAHVTPRR